MTRKIEFSPDWISPPGDSISDLLEEKGWSQTEFALRMGYTKKHITQLISGNASLTEETASKLELVLGGNVGFWLTREVQYREALRKKEEFASYEKYKDWLKELPIADMIRFGWISKKQSAGERVIECLRFFGVASVDAWRGSYEKPILAFRASDKSKQKIGSVAAWLRFGELTAGKKETVKFNERVLRSKLEKIRELTLELSQDKFISKLENLLAEAGVILVIAPTPKGCPISGLTKWISSDKALIMLSFRYKSNDHFWFTLFHEIAHVLLHRKKMLYLETEIAAKSEEETEADKFAGEILIPPRSLSKLKEITLDEKSIREFADELSIPAGIVLGRLQKEKSIPWNTRLNSLKVFYNWV